MYTAVLMCYTRVKKSKNYQTPARANILLTLVQIQLHRVPHFPSPLWLRPHACPKKAALPCAAPSGSSPDLGTPGQEPDLRSRPPRCRLCTRSQRNRPQPCLGPPAKHPRLSPMRLGPAPRARRVGWNTEPDAPAQSSRATAEAAAPGSQLTFGPRELPPPDISKGAARGRVASPCVALPKRSALRVAIG